jgi:hypothetical protein
MGDGFLPHMLCFLYALSIYALYIFYPIDLADFYAILTAAPFFFTAILM